MAENSIPVDTQGNKTDPLGRDIDNFLRNLLGGEGEGGNETSMGVLPQAPTLGSAASGKSLGMQAAPVPVDPLEPFGGAGPAPVSVPTIIGDVPSLDDGGEDARRFPIPPRKPEVPVAGPVPATDHQTIYDDDPEQGFMSGVGMDMLEQLGVGPGSDAAQAARLTGNEPFSIMPRGVAALGLGGGPTTSIGRPLLGAILQAISRGNRGIPIGTSTLANRIAPATGVGLAGGLGPKGNPGPTARPQDEFDLGTVMP
jgi:hypothetical protein